MSEDDRTLEESEAPAASDRAVRRFWLATLLLSPVSGVILFLIAGTTSWLGAWVYLAVAWVSSIVGGLVIPRDLAAERGTIPDGMAAYDKVIAPLLARGFPLVTFIVAGLDHRYGWSPALGVTLPALGLIACVAGAALMLWAMASNRFFSGVMRIQTERGHRVVDTGPYARARHPGYSGLLLFTLGTPLLLGSLWALAPSAASAALIVLRTVFEDRALEGHLEGYAGYAQRVRFRLLPGVW
jgi:protein-S-isoprenylcysteine O-methyltransferase Ste14